MAKGASKLSKGGGGGNQKIALSPKAQLAKDISDYLNEQVNVDIDKYRDQTTKNFDGENAINIDWKSMPKTEQQKVSQALNKRYSPFRAEMSGVWMLTIQRKKG